MSTPTIAILSQEIMSLTNNLKKINSSLVQQGFADGLAAIIYQVGNGTGGGFTTQYGVVATPGSSQTNAALLTADYCIISVVATTNDSTILRLAIPDTHQYIRNETANDVYVYPQPGEYFINPVTGLAMVVDAPFIIGGYNGYMFTCYEGAPGVYRIF